MHRVSAIFYHRWVSIYSILYPARSWLRSEIFRRKLILLNATNFEIVDPIIRKSLHFNRYIRERNKKNLFLIFAEWSSVVIYLHCLIS